MTVVAYVLALFSLNMCSIDDKLIGILNITTNQENLCITVSRDMTLLRLVEFIRSDESRKNLKSIWKYRDSPTKHRNVKSAVDTDISASFRKILFCLWVRYDSATMISLTPMRRNTKAQNVLWSVRKSLKVLAAIILFRRCRTIIIM